VVSYQTDDYYPFGLEISRGTVTSPKNEYLYNKKELQEELGQYDYGARFYDPVVERWTTVDPLAETDRRWSQYNYVEDNPIRNIDPDGMATEDAQGIHSDSPEEAQAMFRTLQAQQGQPPKKKKLSAYDLLSRFTHVENGPKINKLTHWWQRALASFEGGRDYNGINYDNDGNPVRISLLKDEFPFYVTGPGEAIKIWAFWSDYEKTVVNGEEYAKIGERLFTRHAVERMAPSGLGKAAGGVVGRSISPNFVEEVISRGIATNFYKDGNCSRYY